MEYPRLHLSIDNCFASKRWTRPDEWMDVVQSLGLGCVEASADNECDPLYAGEEYLRHWAGQTRAAMGRTGVKVSGLYSGHGTYATLGLAHTDATVRERMRERWVKPMMDLAAGLGTGLGCYCFAFSDSVLQDGALYGAYYGRLCRDLAHLCRYAGDKGLRFFAIEQMYSPHQVPFTLNGTGDMLQRVYAEAGYPLYITVDTGHQVGQRRFLQPPRAELEARIREGRPGWLGPQTAYDAFALQGTPGEKADAVQAEMGRASWMFAREEDGETAAWLERFGMYSPIIHLQQTDGRQSAHWPFTDEYNRAGQVRGRELLDALMRGADAPEAAGMPPRVSDIYLTLEIFSGTAAYNRDLLQALAESVAYWRQFVPRDGIRLDEAWRRLQQAASAEARQV